MGILFGIVLERLRWQACLDRICLQSVWSPTNYSLVCTGLDQALAHWSVFSFEPHHPQFTHSPKSDSYLP